MTETTTREFEARVAQATAYVRSRFYPPLPAEYGRLAVEAVDACNHGDPEETFDVSDLEIQPQGTDDDGQVTAARLVEVLRLEHMIEPDESPQECEACDGQGYVSEPTAFSGPVCVPQTCDECNGTGIFS